MNRTITRGLRVAIVLRNGHKFNQVFEIEAADMAACENVAEFYTKGALSVLSLINEEDILDVSIDWADAWDSRRAIRAKLPVSA